MKKTNRVFLCLTLLMFTSVSCSNDSDDDTKPTGPIYLSSPGNILTCIPNGSTSRCSIKESKKLDLVETPLRSPALIRLYYTFKCPDNEGISPIMIQSDAQQRRFIFNQEDKSISLFGWKGSQITIGFADDETFFTAPQGGCLLKIDKLTTQTTTSSPEED